MNTCKRLISLLLAVLMALALVSCGAPADSGQTAPPTSAPATPDASAGVPDTSAPPTDSGAPTYGGEMTMYYHEFYNYYDPAMPTSYSYAFWLEGLWAMDWASDYPYNSDYWTYENLAGQIADSWEVADDYSTLTVTLRDDVFFRSEERRVGKECRL